MRRIGLMGGSFNPIHLAHVHMARAALDGGYVDEVLFLPTGNPPHKRSGLEDKLDRLAMVELAVAGERAMRASRVEIDREGVIYTVDTLRILREQMPDCRFVYLIGADTLFQLKTWREIDTVITLCDLLLCRRPGEDEEAVQQAIEAWERKGARIACMAAEPMDISSTQVRGCLASGEPVTGMLAPQVLAYIRERGLYEVAKTPISNELGRMK